MCTRGVSAGGRGNTGLTFNPCTFVNRSMIKGKVAFLSKQMKDKPICREFHALEGREKECVCVCVCEREKETCSVALSGDYSRDKKMTYPNMAKYFYYSLRYLRGLSVSDACSECQASRGQSSPCDRREGP